MLCHAGRSASQPVGSSAATLPFSSQESSQQSVAAKRGPRNSVGGNALRILASGTQVSSHMHSQICFNCRQTPARTTAADRDTHGSMHANKAVHQPQRGRYSLLSQTCCTPRESPAMHCFYLTSFHFLLSSPEYIASCDSPPRSVCS